ncbi:MAG: BatA domain-containing protein [Kiritimatiellia bacterium]|jgi:hypothetical protein
MEFVVPLMLAGLAGIAVPILIHLFNRRTARTVDWGAFQFLRDSLMKRRRRLLLEETLLLVCRCLVVALVALALARPFIQAQSRLPWAVVLPLVFVAVTTFGAAFALWPYRRWRFTLLAAAFSSALLIAGAIAFERHVGLGRLGRGTSRDVAIIIDCSASMGMTRDGVSNHARILKEIETDIRTADRGIAFGIIQGGPLPRRLTPAPLTDRRPLFKALETVRPAAGTLDVPAALAAAAALLAEGDNRAKQIVVYGDGQAAGWAAGDETRWNVVKAILSQLPDPPRILWRTLEIPTSLRNLAVEDIAPGRAIVGTDRETTIQVTLKNTGKESVTPDHLALDVEGHHLVNHAIGQITPGASRVVEFRHRFARAGTEILTATLDARDDIALDDTAQRVVQVVGTLDVLLVEANAGARLNKQTTGFLKAALRPEVQHLAADGAAERSAFLVAPKVESAAAVARRASFQDCAVIVLADVPQLPKDVADRIAQFVASGGGLLVAPGGRVAPEFYNDWTWRGESALPLPLKTFATERRSRRRPSLDPETFVGRTLRNLQAQNDLKRAIVAGWWQMDAAMHPERVEGALTTGDPFLAVRRLGRGTVATTALPLDASLSNLPSLQSFLPLVHEIAYALANPATAELNLDPSPSPLLMLSPGGLLVGAGGALGLVGHYYPAPDFKGRERLRVDPNIAFDWRSKAPLSGIPSDRFSIRWIGSFVPQETGEYNFAVEADDFGAVWVNGKPGSEKQSLQAGVACDIRVDYQEHQGNANVRLVYGGAGGRTGDVPSNVLRPAIPSEIDSSILVQPTEIHPASGSTNAIPAQYVHNADGLALQVRANLEPGLYEATSVESLAELLKPFLSPSGAIPFVVRAGIAESDLTTASPEALAFLRRFIDLDVATKPDEISTALRGKRFGREIWRPIAGAALLFLLLELLLSRWIAIQRRTGQEEEVEFDKTARAPEPFQKQLEALRNRGKRTEANEKP